MKDDRFITGELDINDMDLVNQLMDYKTEEELEAERLLAQYEFEQEMLEDLRAMQYPL